MTTRIPAEWESHQSIWMGWPQFEYAEARPIKNVQAEIIKALSEHVQVDLVVQDSEDERESRQWLKERLIPVGHVRFHSVPHTDVWFRDVGPIFAQQKRGGLTAIDFGFNLWGVAPLDDRAALIDGNIDRTIAAKLRLPTLPSAMVLEGGGLEFNGEGTLITTESVVFDRNPDITKEQAEAEFRRLFGVTKTIWLAQGMAEDDSPLNGRLPGNLFTMGTNGHVDEFVRFVDSNTVLLTEISDEEAEKDPIAAISRERLQAAFEILSREKNQDGEPLRVLRMPAAPKIVYMFGPDDYMYDQILRNYKFRDGSTIDGEPIEVIAATSYLNYLVTNGVVLVAKYGADPADAATLAHDSQAKEILGRCFPTREIVQLDVRNLNQGGGGIHCITQQQPNAAPGR